MYHVEVYTTHKLKEVYHKLSCLSTERERMIKPTLSSEDHFHFENETHEVTDISHLVPQENSC